MTRSARVANAYRLYTLKQDGHIGDPPLIVECADDGDAIRQARQYLDGKDLEIWDEGRFVARLTPNA
jgi:hypothetical protein